MCPYLADGGVGDYYPEIAAAAHDVLRGVHRVYEVYEHLRALMAATVKDTGYYEMMWTECNFPNFP